MSKRKVRISLTERHASDRPDLKRAVEECIKRGIPFKYESRTIEPDGGEKVECLQAIPNEGLETMAHKAADELLEKKERPSTPPSAAEVAKKRAALLAWLGSKVAKLWEITVKGAVRALLGK